MAPPKRGELWLADLGMAAKVRPVLVISVPYGDNDYALVCVIPRTTTPRGSQFEVGFVISGMPPGTFNLQGMLAVPASKFLRKITTLNPAQMQQIEAAVKKWLGLP